MKYYWINLENADIRRNNILKEFSDNNITNHYRVNAYTSPIKNKRHYENACCRSHIQAMTHFLLDTNDEYGLICEDDLTFELKKYWKGNVEDVVKNAPSDWGIIQLATIIQNIEPKFKDKDVYFKWGEQKSSSCLAWVIHRKCAIKLLNNYLKEKNIYQFPAPDCFVSGIYQRVDKYTEYTSYTFKYPMFVYPDNNDSQLDNSLDLHKACKRQLIQYLEKHKDIDNN